MITLEKISLEKNENNVYASKYNYPFPYNLTKPSHAKSKKSKIALAYRPNISVINLATPEKMRLDSAIKYFENVVISSHNYANKQFENMQILEGLDLKKNLSNIPKIFEENFEESKLMSNRIDSELPYSQGLFERNRNERYSKMIQTSYLFQIYCYMSLKNPNKALEKAIALKSEYKLNSKAKYELNMLLAEIYLELNQPTEAIKCLKIDEAFEDSSDIQIGSDSYNNTITVENLITGIKEQKLPKNAVMYLNIATCNYFLGQNDYVNEAISQALVHLDYPNQEEIINGRNIKMHEIPGFMSFALIYMCLDNGDEETALKILKKRRFDKTADDLLNM